MTRKRKPLMKKPGKKTYSNFIYGLPHRLNFGKYKGWKLSEVIRRDAPYIRWCLENIKWFKIGNKAQVELSKYPEIRRRRYITDYGPNGPDVDSTMEPWDDVNLCYGDFGDFC